MAFVWNTSKEAGVGCDGSRMEREERVLNLPAGKRGVARRNVLLRDGCKRRARRRVLSMSMSSLWQGSGRNG